jgi:hypothetical protein
MQHRQDADMSAALLLVLLFAAVSVLWAMAPLSRAELGRFAKPRQLEITPANGEMVMRYLVRVRSARWTGAAVGAVIAMLWALSLWLVGAIAGALLGSLLAAAAPPRRRDVDRGPALLVRRSMLSYASRVSLGLVAVAWALLIALVALRGDDASLGEAVGLLTASVVTGGAFLGARRHVTAPQIASSPDVVQADDAVRAAAVQLLTAVTALVVSLTVVVLAARLDGSFPAQVTVSSSAGLIALVAFITRNDTVRVRRTYPRVAR